MLLGWEIVDLFIASHRSRVACLCVQERAYVCVYGYIVVDRCSSRDAMSIEKRFMYLSRVKRSMTSRVPLRRTMISVVTFLSVLLSA